MKHKIKRGQIWIDKKTGNKMIVNSKNHDIIWNCVLIESGTTHKMTEKVINRYWYLDEEINKIKSQGTGMESL